MTISIAARKAKARKAQQWFRDQLLAAFPHLTEEDIRSTPMGVPGEDIQLSTAARKAIGFSIEVKARASLALYTWMEQRIPGPHPALVVAKADRKRPVVILYADDFLNLLKR